MMRFSSDLNEFMFSFGGIPPQTHPVKKLPPPSPTVWGREYQLFVSHSKGKKAASNWEPSPPYLSTCQQLQVELMQTFVNLL